MKNYQPYIVNHSKASKFPWSIYHKPILDSLSSFLSTIKDPSKKKILVIGPGEFKEIGILISRGFNISVLDIDERVLLFLRSKYGSLIENYFLVDENLNGYPADGSFDIIYAKEVIEHFMNPDLFLEKIKAVLSPNGLAWLSTPNYGNFLLPFLEKTILEIVARFSGFSRKDIHPSKFSDDKLMNAIQRAGFHNILINITPWKLALTVTMTR